MRLELAERTLTVAPGAAAEVELEVFNTGQVIDGLSARVIGLDDRWVTSRPAQLALFPDTSGHIVVRIDLPPGYPAGTHQVMVEVASSVDRTQVERAPLAVAVSPLAQVALSAVPPQVSGHRKGRFTILCDNEGNRPIELRLQASDPERSMQCRFEPPSIQLAPGQSARVAMHVRAPRRLFGQERARPLHVVASAPDLEAQTQVIYQQRPRIPRGVVTACILGLIIALWAVAFLVGMKKAFAPKHYAKSTPASFYASTASGTGASSDGTSDGSSAAAAPAGAVSKDGASPEVAATISGTVLARSTGQGVGRITVEAIRDSPTGPKLVASAASQADGSYAMQGLFPDSYRLRFSSPGFRDVWYPSSTDEAGAKVVVVGATEVVKGIDATIEGLPGTFTGQVDTGDPTTPVPVTVTVRAAATNAALITPLQATTDTAGRFQVPGLPAPGQYELTFTAAGYQTATSLEKLGGGEVRTTNTVRMSAGPGTIAGTVTDGTKTIGDVAVATTVSGQAVATATPTSGSVGHFSLANLPTPGTYLVTFTKDQFGTQTVAISLGPGQTRTDVDVVLVGGTGTITGKVVDRAGKGLGEVTVSVGGGRTSASTKTLTADPVGSYQAAGLATPGDYTVSFALPGYGTETVAVHLDTNGAAKGIDATLLPSIGTLHGTVVSTADGKPIGNATITVTDGTKIRTTTAASNPAGQYTVTDLAPGSYSVTVSADNFSGRTALVKIVPGSDTTQDLALPPATAGVPTAPTTASTTTTSTTRPVTSTILPTSTTSTPTSTPPSSIPQETPPSSFGPAT